MSEIIISESYLSEFFKACISDQSVQISSPKKTKLGSSGKQ